MTLGNVLGIAEALVDGGKALVDVAEMMLDCGMKVVALSVPVGLSVCGSVALELDDVTTGMIVL